MIDVNTESIVWEGKNVPADELQLKVPMSDLDCAFANQGQTLVTSTAYGKVRLFDFRVNKKRPVKDKQLDKNALTSLCFLNQSNSLLVGSNIGEVYSLDHTKDWSINKKFNDAHGTITDIQATHNGKHFCTSKR